MHKIFNFYIKSSIHVSLAILALTILTYILFDLSYDSNLLMFVFSSSVVGYNFTKYNDIVFSEKKYLTHKWMLILSLICGLLACWGFIKLNFSSKILVSITSLFTILYTVPVFRKKSFRDFSGLKIYIVALCWVVSTLLLPLSESEFDINTDVLIKSIQRFVLVIILILIFEIIDLKEDNPKLKTVPQSIGVKKTKILNFGLSLVFFSLEFLLSSFKTSQLYINSILLLAVLGFNIFASEKKSKYYTTFWVESIPILWLILVVFFR